MSLPLPEVCKDEKDLEKLGSSPRGGIVSQQEQRKRRDKKGIYIVSEALSRLGVDNQALGPGKTFEDLGGGVQDMTSPP